MESRAAVSGHPIHVMLVVFPLGLLPAAFLFDLIYVWRRDPFWRRAAFVTIVLGELGALAAIPFGVWDYLYIAMPEAVRRLATLHLGLGIGAAALYGLQIWLRRGPTHGATPSGAYPPWLVPLAFLSVVAILVQGGIGGDLSHVHRLGVAPAPRPPAAPRESQNAAELAAGRAMFLQHCARCHGRDAEGKDGPRLAGNELTVDFIGKTVAEGRWPVMPAFGGKLSPERIRQVAAYVRSLGSR